MISLEYGYGQADVDAVDEVVLLDEPKYRQDFNADADIFDENIRSVQEVDRSSQWHDIGLGVRFRLARGLSATFEYDHRMKTYSSSNQLDPARFDRTDERDAFGLSVGYTITKHWGARTGYEYRIATTDRLSDPDNSGSGTDYRRSTGYISVEYSW